MYGVLTDNEIISRLNELDTITNFNLTAELPEVIRLLIDYEKTYDKDFLFYKAHPATDIVSKIFFTLTREAQDSGRYALCDKYSLQEDAMYNSTLEENMRRQVLYDGIVHYYKRHTLPKSMDIGSLASLCRYLFAYIKEKTYSEYEDLLELVKKRA